MSYIYRSQTQASVQLHSSQKWAATDKNDLVHYLVGFSCTSVCIHSGKPNLHVIMIMQTICSRIISASALWDMIYNLLGYRQTLVSHQKFIALTFDLGFLHGRINPILGNALEGTIRNRCWSFFAEFVYDFLSKHNLQMPSSIENIRRHENTNCDFLSQCASWTHSAQTITLPPMYGQSQAEADLIVAIAIYWP